MRPTRPTVRGIAASCAAVLVAFLVAVSWPGAAAHARSASSAPSASVNLGDGPSATPRAAGLQPDSAHDHEATAAGDHDPAILGAGVTLALALLGLLALVTVSAAEGRLHAAARGRAPPAFA
ncbi:hypothetical protein D9V41_11145 [Aeromicrobium phragmitis]|uniref:Uncharacterized protein n=1 Tax=Aeromicrobium phragmitis TaxID=2478914 RepID=A0A3L8PMP0_9ACTN|nr:hypothetical protein [Aeromicrobium phragmitis]RLV55312.1 hypothetical protein D9V41_11145 [Aeromicrobium phragmitis]